MADSAVAVTAGSGTNIDTRTEATNGNHRQVVVLGDPSTNAGVAPVDATEGLMVHFGATDNAVLDNIDSDTSTIATNTGNSATSLGVMDDWDNAASDGASVSGDVAHDTADAGEPVKVGFKAYNQDGTAPGAAVTEADRTNGISDLYGRQFVATEHPNYVYATDNQSSAQTNTQLIAAPGANLSIYITDIIISNGATAGTVKLVEDTSGTPADVFKPLYVAINGGAVISFKTPKKLTANKNLGYTSATVTTHSITVSGYVAP